MFNGCIDLSACMFGETVANIKTDPASITNNYYMRNMKIRFR